MDIGETWALDYQGRWHITTKTTSNTADTKCGKTDMPTVCFEWHLRGRPKATLFCPVCAAAFAIGNNCDANCEDFHGFDNDKRTRVLKEDSIQV
jgi:hypothetical protein